MEMRDEKDQHRGKLRVYVEEDRHVDFLPWSQSLLLEAEALYLVEVLARLLGHSCSNSHLVKITSIPS